MVRTVTKDLIFDAILTMEGKGAGFQKAWISGLISGINVQMALVKIDASKAYDGSLGAVLRVNADQSFEVMKDGLDGPLKSVLTQDLFVNYDLLQTDQSQTYLIAFGTGQIEVCRKFNIMNGLGILKKESIESMNFWAGTACDSLQKMF